jgi:hypothetical protein
MYSLSLYWLSQAEILLLITLLKLISNWASASYWLLGEGLTWEVGVFVDCKVFVYGSLTLTHCIRGTDEDSCFTTWSNSVRLPL